MIIGATIATLGQALVYATCSFDAVFALWHLVPAMVVLGLGQGMVMTPLVNAVLSGIAERHTGAASGVLTTMQRVGSALGVAILEIPFFATLGHTRATGGSQSAAYTAAYASVAAWLLLAMIIVFTLLWLLPSGREAKAAAS